MVRRIPGACERDGWHRRSPDGGRDRSSLFANRPRLSFLFLLLSLLASPVAPANDTVARSLCDTPPHEEVCPVAPKDNTDFDAPFIYLILIALLYRSPGFASIARQPKTPSGLPIPAATTSRRPRSFP